MAKTLEALLAVARERISGANPAGRNTGSPEVTKTGDSPGIDYAAKSSGDRAFVAKHTHIEQEYPNGMAPVFKGEPVTYSMDDPKMKNYGKKEAESVATYEEVQIDEIAKAAIRRYKRGMAAALNNKEEPPKKDVKEDVESIDEVSKAKLGRYITQAHNSGAKARSRADRAYFDHSGESSVSRKHDKIDDKRSAGIHRAVGKLTGTAKVNAKEEVEVIDEKLSDKTKGHIRNALDNRSIKKGSGGARALIKAAKVKEDVEPIDEAGVRNLSVASRTWASQKMYHQKKSRTLPPSGPNKAALRAQAQSAVADYHAKGGKIHREEVEVDEGILTCKDSLGRKMAYHKNKMKNEDAGSVKFRHHQKQFHICKVMREEAEVLDEKKKEEGKDVIKYDKRGFAMKKRKYGKSNKKDDQGKVIKEETDTFQSNLLRAIEQINKDIS